ncbi:MAG: hypothetical protein IRD7MM_05235 [Candidatus Midichloria mitochondrii]
MAACISASNLDSSRAISACKSASNCDSTEAAAKSDSGSVSFGADGSGAPQAKLGLKFRFSWGRRLRRLIRIFAGF